MRVLAVILLPALILLSCAKGDTPDQPVAGNGGTKASPDPPPGREIQEGLREYRNGDFQKAAVWFRRSVERRPSDPQSHYYLGYSLLQVEKNRAALESLDRSVALQEDFLPARLARARIYNRLGDYREAEKELRFILDREPENLVALFNLGFILSRSGGYSEAIEVLELVSRLRPDHPQAPYYLGLAAIKSGDRVRARTALQEAIRLDPDNPGAHFNLGNLLMRLGQEEEALEHLQIFKRLSDEVTESEHHQEQINIRTVEAFQLQRDGDLAGAIRVTEDLLRIAPGYAPAWKDLAVFHMATNRQEEALKALLRATEIDPNYGAPYFHLARIYRKMGDSQKAAWADDRFRMLESGEGARRQEGRRW